MGDRVPIYDAQGFQSQVSLSVTSSQLPFPVEVISLGMD